MPSWNDLISKLESHQNNQAKAEWLNSTFDKELQKIGTLRKDRNVVFYASAFLQKPQAPAILQQITHEEINGFMSVIHGMDCDRGLTLILHTPGGVTNATETIVADWLAKYMFKKSKNPKETADKVAKYFSRGSSKKSHGRRIDRDEAKGHSVIIEDLENDQDLQEAILTAYHLMTIIFEKTPAIKVLASHQGKRWIKNI